MERSVLPLADADARSAGHTGGALMAFALEARLHGRPSVADVRHQLRVRVWQRLAAELGRSVVIGITVISRRSISRHHVRARPIRIAIAWSPRICGGR